MLLRDSGLMSWFQAYDKVLRTRFGGMGEDAMSAFPALCDLPAVLALVQQYAYSTRTGQNVDIVERCAKVALEAELLTGDMYGSAFRRDYEVADTTVFTTGPRDLFQYMHAEIKRAGHGGSQLNPLVEQAFRCVKQYVGDYIRCVGKAVEDVVIDGDGVLSHRTKIACLNDIILIETLACEFEEQWGIASKEDAPNPLALLDDHLVQQLKVGKADLMMTVASDQFEEAAKRIRAPDFFNARHETPDHSFSDLEAAIDMVGRQRVELNAAVLPAYQRRINTRINRELCNSFVKALLTTDYKFGEALGC